MTGKTKDIRILIADESPILREALYTLLGLESGFSMVGESSNTEDVLRQATVSEPDVILTAFSGSGLSALEILRRIEKENIRAKVLLFTEGITQDQLIDTIVLGGRGIVYRSCTTPLLIKSIRVVASGELWFRRYDILALVRLLKTRTESQKFSPSVDPSKFTKREKDIIAAIVDGCTNRDIANVLSLNEQTVKHHLTNIYRKARVSNRLELAAFAMHHPFSSEEKASLSNMKIAHRKPGSNPDAYPGTSDGVKARKMRG